MKQSLLVALSICANCYDFQLPLGLNLKSIQQNSKKAVSRIIKNTISSGPVIVGPSSPRQPFKITRSSDEFDFHVTHSDFPNHKLRVKSPNKLGVDDVKQYSGYLDVGKKHFFFWFFEARENPKNAPTVLWENGGPGCSSLTGLFMELGPGRINKNGKVERNPYAWNNNSNVIFIDQPVNVGFSYSDEKVSDSVAAAEDVQAFIHLFFKQFPEYANKGFHIAGESYAGRYLPVLGEALLAQKKNPVNLTSVLIGNGLTDPYVQYDYYAPMACGEGGHKAVLSESECDGMRRAQPRCKSLIEQCYRTQSSWLCMPAAMYCNNVMMGPYQKTGLNVYDIRGKCEDSSNLCYPILGYVSKYLNRRDVQDAIGAEVSNYESCNFDINKNFLFQGDWMKPYHLKVPEILKKVPMLIYAGDKDFICNWLGNKAWTEEMEWSGKKEYNAAEFKVFKTEGNSTGQAKSAHGLTFLRVFEAGHMVPYDQAKGSLDFLNKWIRDLKL